MSISDSEDLDTKPSAQPRPTETPPRRQKRGLNNNNNNCSGNDPQIGDGTVVQNMTLSSEQQMELSYQRTATLLRGVNSSGDYNGSKSNKEIIIIPSLVSLSDDFFKIHDKNNGNDNYDDEGGNNDLDGSHFSSSAALPDLPANNNNLSGPPRLRPRLNLRGNSSTSSSSDISMTNNNNNSSSGGGGDNLGGNSVMMSQQHLVRPQDDWPIGPQGAQVPSYLLDKNNGGGGNELTHSSSTNSLVDAAESPSAAAAGRNLQDSPQRSAARRVREIMTRQQQNQQQSPPVHYINAVQSLEHAVQRLEETLRQRDVDGHDLSHRGLPGSGAYSISSPGGKKKKPSMEDLEVGTLTQLAEIMLHPPTDIVNGRYCWKGEKEAKVVAGSDDGGGGSDGSNGEKDDEGGRMMMMTSPLPPDEMEIGKDDDNEGDGNGNWKDDNDAEMMMPDDDMKNESSSSLLLPITSLLNKQSRYPTLNAAETSISTLGKSCPTRRVCQHPFRRNDIVWVCRTCQSDETCVLCHDCFSNSNHVGHDVAFYHAQAGGCCDCGDADAWDPKGFCNKHGGQNGQGAPPGTAVAKSEPAVLGSVHACADWLVDVVQSGVEDGYRRANPLLLVTADGKRNNAGVTRAESVLPESYEEQRERQGRRERSLTRRNTVADMETTPPGAEDEGSRASNSMLPSNSMMSFDAVLSEAASTDFDESGHGIESRVSTPIIHEVQFDPAAASSSRRRSESNATTNSSKRDAGSSIDGNIFCPTAASTSKSSSSHRRASKKARAPPKSPARALGDLGRDGCGLFLVVHSDDIRIGAHSPHKATKALKEFFSKSVSADAGGAGTSAWDTVSGTGGDGLYFAASAGPFPGVDDDGRVNRPNIRIAPRISRFRSSNLDSIVDKILRIIKKRGELIVWGTQELLAECGDVTARCWRDGDSNSSSLIGAAMLNRAKLLTDGGLVCSIKTREEVVNEQTATSIIKLINLVAQSCDPLCDQVSSGISGRGVTSTLPPLLRNDLKLPYKLVSSWHALLLTLLAVPNFKASLANAYCDTYRAVTGEYARGVGLIERSAYTLSVQFLNRISYVTDLVRERSLITNLFLCLYEILSLATISDVPTPVMRDFDNAGTSNLIAAIMVLLGHASLVGADDESLFRAFDAELNDIMNRSGGDSRHHGRVSTRGLTREHHRNLIEKSAMLNPKLDPTHDTLAHRRYSVCISDLKCVLNVVGMARHFASVPCKGGDDVPSALNSWIKTLSLAQNMDGQCWKDYSQAHVERENSNWVGAFNTSISLGSLYERLLKWEDSDPSPIDNCVTPVKLLSCADLCYYTLTKGVDKWQRGEMLSCLPTPAPSSMKVDHALKPASLPFSTVASAHGTPLAMTALPLSQLEPFSFHLPLHRFAAACAREVSRRTDHNGGLLKLIDKFRVNSNASDEARENQRRKNDLLFRGMMEFPIIVLSRAAQIRAGIWKRNGPGMSDMVLNYSEPPFCRNLQDADIFLVQLALVCMATLTEGEDETGNVCLSSLNSAGTARLVNLLIHRFGVFDFLGFKMAPQSNLDRYIGEIRSGMYPAEIKPMDKNSENVSVYSSPAMPWTYTPARDSAHEMFLLGELLHLLITLITELPPPPCDDESQHAVEARRRLMREVIHRLVSGPKTHSEMTEVSHILSNRDTDALCELGKKINPDDASGAALEEALNEVGTRKCKSGAPDEWELKESAWSEYDPSFQHISTRAHQHASENRPKQKAGGTCLPYAPKPLPSHKLFSRLRRDLTADATLVACIYRVLHVHCHRPSVVLKSYPGRRMYEADASETVLARAVHFLTLGVYAWDEDVSTDRIDSAHWKSQGGCGVGSVFVNFDRRPTACDWVDKVLLRNPYEIMQQEEYRDDVGSEQNILWLLRQIAMETQTREQDMSGFLGGLDQSLVRGAMFICDFAAKVNPEAAIVAKHCKVNSAKGNADDLAKRKNAAKEKALAAMKAQMAKFAANLGGDDEDDQMSDAEGNKASSTRDDSRMLATPVRQRTDSTGLVEAMDLSPHGDFLMTPSFHPSTPFTPRTPQTPFSPGFDEANESTARLFVEIPRCIICGADDKIDCNNNAGSSTMFQQKEKRTLAFCGFAQASRVIQGGSGDPSDLRDEEKKTWRHVGVHTALCGHAIHKSCCETYMKTSQRDRLADRSEGGKRQFRCPLCQRLSNCLVPFVDVAADWLDSPSSSSKVERPSITANDGMVIDGLSCDDCYKPSSLHDFLSSSKWWATKNDGYLWDGQCNLIPATDSQEKKVSSSASVDRHDTSSKKNFQGKKELIKAWNSVLRTPRRLQRRPRPSGFVLTPPGSTELKDSNNSDILRKLMDQIVDVGQRADLKRLGEEELTKDYGEFRHYLTERTIYNKRHRAAGKDILDWPLCLTSTSMSDSRRQELSKEKMVSKLLYSIQAFTYSCCAESSDCRRLLHSKSVDTTSIFSKFGVGKALIGNDLLLLPRAETSAEGGFQPFDGRLGKARYLGLALMAAASPVAKEIIQLCIPFPLCSDSSTSDSVFDFDADDESKTAKRAPIAYPLLCSNILTHTTGALIALTGNARAEEGNFSTDEVVDDCRKFISLGLVARIVQVLLTDLMSWNGEQIDIVLRSMHQDMIDDTKQAECSWRQSCLDLLRFIFGRESEEEFLETENSDANLIESQISKGIDAAKQTAVSFLLDVAVIVQILVPNIFSDAAMHPDSCGPSDLEKMERLMELICLESIDDMIQSNLVQQVIKSWYIKATEKSSSQLQPPPDINYDTWPVVRDQRSNSNDEIPPHCSPLLGYPSNSSPIDPCRITCLPKSYTDLYAQLSTLRPDNDQIALCLICGSVLDAGGKGECTKHASKCGGGSGMFFLVQECVGLIMHGTKAAYVPSIFVDSHGETPQYRGRPLNLDPQRWSLLQDMWCSHSVREKVISERSTTRQVIIQNYY